MTRYITFDLYGTLVDIESALQRIFREIDRTKARRLYEEWNKKNFENINSRRVSFKYSAKESLQVVLGDKFSSDRFGRFLDYYASARPFPGTVDVLKKLKTCYTLAVISNIDNDIIRKTLEFFDFDEIITSEDAGFFYKPNKKIFEFALKRLGCRKEDITHVASSVRADMNGVVPLGWNFIFLNRNGIHVNTKTIEKLSDLLHVLQKL